MYTKVSYLNYGTLRSIILQYGFRCDQQYTNLQLLEQRLTKSAKLLRQGNVRKKWGYKLPLPSIAA